MDIAPLQVLLELTTSCNMQCRHCLVGTSNASQNELSYAEIVRILDELHQMGVFQINLTGGEPFLRSDIWAILSYLADFGDAMQFLVLTNGTLLNKEYVRKLSKTARAQPNLAVQVSLDGCLPALYNRLRVTTPQMFEKVVQALKALVRNNVGTNVCFTVTRLNINYALKTAQFALDNLGVNSVHILPIFPAGRALKSFKALQPSPSSWGKLLMQLTTIRRTRSWGENSQKISVGFLNFYEFFVAMMSQGAHVNDLKEWGISAGLFRLKSRGKYVFCHAGYEDLCVTSDGWVFPCMPSRGLGFDAGNVRKESLNHIWNESDVLNWFRRRNWSVTGACRLCDFFDVCGGGCRVRAYALQHDLYASDPVCPISAGQITIDHKWVDAMAALKGMI